MQWEWLIRIILGGILGGVIGIERKRRFKDAGFKTHFLVGVGSALLMIISQYGFVDSKVAVDPSRLAAQVVSGIGFLGAGTILTHKGGVTGLTTAAGLWVTSALGLAVGCGMYILAITVAILTLIGLEFTRIKEFLRWRKNIEMIIGMRENKIDEIFTYFKKNNIHVLSYQYDYYDDLLTKYELKLMINISKKLDLGGMLRVLQSIEEVDYIKNT